MHLDKVRPAERRGKYIDATLGAGGYSLPILKCGGMVLGIDADPKMIAIAKERLEKVPIGPTARPGSFFKAVNANFVNIDSIARENGFENVDGIVFDLGISNIHFLGDDRGFSFSDKEAPLDMRLNPGTQAVKASDLLNKLRDDQLRLMLGWNLAQEVVKVRSQKPFEKVGDLTALIGGTPLRRGYAGRRTHPATKAFLALRMAVNSELENLREALPKALGLLRKGGVLAVVTFNSDEDRVVKNFRDGGEIILPSREEVLRNPKARSAKLRVLIK